MTREEAIVTLRANYPDKCYESLRNAVDMAIEALQADPSEIFYDGYVYCLMDFGKDVVLCKDCIHHEDEEPGMVYCPNFVGGWVSNMFYCGHGERKAKVWEEPEINPCRGCADYDGKGGCISNGGCGTGIDEVEE